MLVCGRLAACLGPGLREAVNADNQRKRAGGGSGLGRSALSLQDSELRLLVYLLAQVCVWSLPVLLCLHEQNCTCLMKRQAAAMGRLNCGVNC